jgi:hypothetical protein
MERSDLIQHEGKFGILKTINDKFKKELPGWIKEVDSSGNVWFVDTDNHDFIFKSDRIKSFEPEEFKGNIN